MKTKIKVILWCAWLLILGLQEGWSQKPTPQQPSERIVKEVLRFAEGRKFSFRRRIKETWQECYVFSGDNVRIEVDAVTEKVTYVLYSEPYPLISKERLTNIDEIEKKLKSWLKEKGIDLEGWNLEKREIYGERIFFNWAKRSPKGVGLPCVLSVNVWVSVEGVEIGSIHWIERPVEVSLKPTIKEEEAIKIAIEAAKFSKAKVVKRDLYVWFGEGGRQELWWDITLEENKIRRTVVINAHTGKIKAIYYYK